VSQSIISATEQLVRPMLDENGFELIDVEYVKEGSNRFLRVIVDKPGGIDIEDCSRISEYLSARLDETDPISDAYFLEVTSPGAERPLKKPDDFRHAVGKHVLITTYEPVQGHKEFEGTLESYDAETASVRIGTKLYSIPADKIANARLAVIF
jgi:ribosome maturation factor RimP